MKTLGAIALGLFLGSVPFLRYAIGSGHGAAHADHDPKHGGQLRMVGDPHEEVVRRGGLLEAFVSDAQRVPVEVRDAKVWLDDPTPPPARPGSDAGS